MQKKFALTSMALSLSLLLSGCSGGGGGSSSSESYSELLAVSDQDKVKLYSVSEGAATLKGSATIPGIPGTYSRAGNVITVNQQYHNLNTDTPVELDFSGGATDGVYKITKIDAHSYTVTDSASGDIASGEVVRKPKFSVSGTYVQSAKVLTVTMPGHVFQQGYLIGLDFTSGDATDQIGTISSITDGNTFTVTMASDAEATGNVDVTLGINYTILDVVMHPSGKWIYASTTYDCWNGSPYCWGGDVISRFKLNWDGSLTFEKSFRTSTKDGDFDAEDAAPVAMTFNKAGTLMFHQCDSLDGIRMWSVNTTTGDIEIVASVSGTGNHGVQLSDDETLVFNGAKAWTIGTEPYSLTLVASPVDTTGQGGRIIGKKHYFMIPNNWKAAVYSSETDATAPVLVSEFSTSSQNQARDMAVNDAGTLMVTSGWTGLKVFGFDGTTVTEAVPASGSSEFKDAEAWNTGDVKRMYRRVSLNNAGNLVAAAYFSNVKGITGGAAPSGFVLLNLSSDGALSKTNDYSDTSYSRVVKFIYKP